VIPEAARQGIDPNFTFTELSANPDAARGRRVALGGKVLQVTPGQQETEIEVLQYPLRFDDSPDLGAPSAGRFIIRRAGFLDPAVYATDRLLTVAGPVEGSAERPVGQATYRYPIVRADYLFLWPPYELVYPPPPFPYYYYPYPYWAPYPYYRYRFYFGYGYPFWW
jgi:outer membrane lipoprotein